jgi:uncharacterized protein
MEIKTRLESELKDAMRSGNDVRKRTIRMALANIKNTEIDKGAALDDATILSILQKEIKIRKEAIEDAKKGNRADLVAENEAEIQVIEAFLPKQMSEAEVLELVKNAIAEVGATAPSDMGKVMKVLLPKVQGQAPGDMVSRLVRMVLAQP